MAEARIDPSQSPGAKETEEHAITRELNSLSPQDLVNTLAEFKKLNSDGWHQILATENKSPTGEITSIDFNPRGYMRGNSEPFQINLK